MVGNIHKDGPSPSAIVRFPPTSMSTRMLYSVFKCPIPSLTFSDSIPRGLHLSGKSTRLYFQVPADVPQFSVTVSTGPPGETSLGKIYAPSGTLVQTLDTQSTPVARATISPEQGLGEWEGFWCLSVEKAPKGVLDDVFVSLDAALPQWFIIDPSEPLKISPLKAFTPLKTFK